MTTLNAQVLKDTLWNALNDLKENKLDPVRGAAIAKSAREILRTVRTQIMILDKANRGVTQDLNDFAGQ